MEIYDRVQLVSFTDIKIDGYDKYNPLDMDGTIISVTGKVLPVIVLWTTVSETVIILKT